MKIYTNTFDVAFPAPHRFWVAPYSDFAIGVKIVKGGEPLASNFTVKQGSTELEPQDDKIDGFTIFTVQSGATGSVEYTIEVEGLIQKQKLYQIVTDSTVFDVGSGGGDVPADVATKGWVNSQISGFAEESELTAYATTDSLTAYATTDSLTAYASKEYVTQETSAFVTAEGASQALSSTTLSAQQAVGWTRDYGIVGHDDPEMIGTEAPGLTSIQTAYESEWSDMSADAGEYPNTLFIVLPDPE